VALPILGTSSYLVGVCTTLKSLAQVRNLVKLPMSKCPRKHQKVWITDPLTFTDDEDEILPTPPSTFNVQLETFNPMSSGSLGQRVTYVSAIASPKKCQGIVPDGFDWNYDTVMGGDPSAVESFDDFDPAYVVHTQEIFGVTPKRAQTAGVSLFP
jgi:hypothetical protein